jgi:hypothetical protein
MGAERLPGNNSGQSGLSSRETTEMPTIHETKRAPIAESPLLLFSCELRSGAVERWSTNRVTWGGQVYESRVLGHNVFEMQSASDDGIDSPARITVTLANADSYLSQIERATGWKGAKLTVHFVFFNLVLGEAASDSEVVFRGVANAPEEITEKTIRLSFTNRMNLQRMLLPEVRLQRRCPWLFPRDAAERQLAMEGGEREKYSPFYRCGYSPDLEGGSGNLNGPTPFAACDNTRASCEQRGMFRNDALLRPTARFGGIEFVPSTVQVRSHGDKNFKSSNVAENEARYNDFVPLVYGTAWFEPPIIFGRNDGNLTYYEILLGMGEIDSVVKVVANQTEIPLGRAGQNMTSTGWYNVINTGSRTGGFNLNFRDAAGQPLCRTASMTDATCPPCRFWRVD